MTDTSRHTGPRTEAGRPPDRLWIEWARKTHPVEVAAIEREAAAATPDADDDLAAACPYRDGCYERLAGMRHYPNDNCGDPNHDAILDAWYARAETLLDRAAAATPHDHEWTREYAPGYRQASEADDWRETCACGAVRTGTDAAAAAMPSLDPDALLMDIQEALAALDGSMKVTFDGSRAAIARNHLRSALARLRASTGSDPSEMYRVERDEIPALARHHRSCCRATTIR